MDASSGCVVLFTDFYRDKANSHPQSALRMEAAAIKERRDALLVPRDLVSKLEAALASAQRARAQQNAALAMRLENRPLASDRARARRFDGASNPIRPGAWSP